MRNFICTLLLSIGTPMLLMGDEYGHTALGNNNPWCQDNDLNYFLWNEIEKNKAWFRFYCLMIDFRKKTPLLKRSKFLTDDEVLWHGKIPLQANWSGDDCFLAYTLKDPKNGEDLYIAFNAYPKTADIELPIPPTGKQWHRIVDTALAAPNDFVENPKSLPPLGNTYEMQAYSVLVSISL